MNERDTPVEVASSAQLGLDPERAAFEAAMAEAGYRLNPQRYRDGPYRDAEYAAGWAMWCMGRENIRAALQWYADGLHFDKASPDAWDTVSGEPQNWWCDEAGTATVEDGSIAAMTLRGELTAAQIQALD